ncbi:ubiquitin carboxyl-terminal hydrolase 31 [Latimeria chalumnae]|uniref:ubiquitin carboxyl-terminal hydrolase 31 n=1 Tax=Latimeria chalumnae TaxID=7897 RepID=UPI00313E58C3
MSKASTKEKKSFSKKLFRRGSVRSVGSFMSRVIKTLSTLSHFGTEEAAAATAEEEKDDGGFNSYKVSGGRSEPPQQQQPPPPPHGGESEPPWPDGEARVPGLAGLKNHGNTCFMNAVLQCLSNTELFAEYLALEQYRGGGGDDSGLAGTEPEQQPPKSNGVQQLFQNKKAAPEKGEVTEQLSNLVRSLWTFEYTPQHSREFKNVVAKNALQYRGNSQHDAQEFLLWLLDRVHEDLNNVVKYNGGPPLKPPVEDDATSEGPSLPVCNTFVEELFQAQYRSSLTCPHCQKQSNTFDPFLCISLPIPLPHTRPLYVTVVYQGKCSHCMRIGVAVPLSGTVARLREAVSLETKIPTDQIVLTEMYYDGFHRSFCDTEDLDTIHESDCIFAFETPEIFRPEGILSQRGMLANLNQNNLKYGTESHRTTTFTQGVVKPVKLELVSSRPTGSDKIVLLVCNRVCSGQQGKRFGHPFVLYLDKTVTWDALQKEILEKLHYILRPGVYIQVGPFSLRVVGVVGLTYLLPQVEQPLSHPTVERAFKSCGPGGPPHVKIVVEWDKETKEYLFGNIEDEYIPDSESVRQQKELHNQPQTCTLSQCIQLYTKEEQLAPDDAWRCPHCKQLQQGSIKLSLWTLPDVLIIHLKRFRQEGDRRMKLQNMIKFPLVGLDMTPHVVKRSQSSWSLPSHWSPWRRPYGLGRDPEDYLYDLYAVCNHHGTMHGGHYTAFCKNSVDGQWYCFDDSDVQQVSEDEVCKQTAYILFYQRRSTVPSWSANSSVAGSTSSSLCEHWVTRLPGSKQPSIASAASSRRTSLASLSESVEFPGDRSEDDGGFSTRPFVRSVQRQPTSSRSSITSPLAVNENGIKPSWSLSAKLQMRSSSPSRFSLDSSAYTMASTLEKIGEASDDKVSTSCFGSLRNQSISFVDQNESSKHEYRSVDRAPLAVMEGALRDEKAHKKSSSCPEDKYNQCTAQSDKKSPKIDISDNNNLISFVDESDSVDSSSVKDAKHHSSSGSPIPKGESTVKKSSSSKGASEQVKSSSRKGQGVLSSQDTSASSSPSTPQQRSSQKASNAKDKTDISKVAGRRVSSVSAQSKKESARSPDSVLSGATQQKQKITSASQLSSPSPTPRKISSTTERGSTLPSSAGRSRVSDRSLSRDKVSPSSEKPGAAVSSKPSSYQKPSQVRASDSGKTEGRQIRSSSSSSSVTSLRSPSISAKSDIKRDSKSEDKGLSFFKSALRQKESRRSADLGKTNILSRKTSEGSLKSGSKSPAGTEARKATGSGSEKGSQPLSPEQTNATKTPTREKKPTKVSTPAKHPLLSASKSKSSHSDLGSQSPAKGKKSEDKTVASKKLSSSMHSSTRSVQKPH